LAICHFGVKSVSRGQGSSVVQRSAYVSRSRVRDEQHGRTHDYRARGGLVHSEVLLPGRVSAAAEGWARDREALWNRAEAAESRANARVGREYVVALPHELSAEQRVELARAFARTIGERYGTAVELAVHRAPPGGDSRNHHAHVLASTRELTASGFGAKSAAELNDRTRRVRGLPSAREELRQLRLGWAALVNERLAAAGRSERIDARSLWEQGSSRVPQPRLPRAAVYAERSGQYSPAAEALRARHAIQQQRMSACAAEHVARLQRGTDAREAAIAGPTAVKRPAREAGADAPLGVDELRRRSVERWLAYRAGEGRTPGAVATQTRAAEHGRDHDTGLEL
jgi:ATP-dependent exoDNAse (exonuclease V) alpha subunit